MRLCTAMPTSEPAEYSPAPAPPAPAPELFLHTCCVLADAWMEVKSVDGEHWYYNAYRKESKWSLSEDELQHLLPPIDPYNNTLVMSLEDFANHPVAQELLHNGASFQVRCVLQVWMLSMLHRIRCSSIAFGFTENTSDA